MATPLQDLYDRFFSKVDEDFTGKEGQVFALVDSAIAKSYKYVVHKLDYVLDEPGELMEESYSGDFTQNLDTDEIELLSLWMVYEWNRKKQQKILSQKRRIGTKDFNRLEDLPKELGAINFTMKITLDDINSLKNEFNTYKY